MPIGEGDVETELLKVRAILGTARGIENFLTDVLRMLQDGGPIWNRIDPTGAQKSALLTDYDAQKAALKSQAQSY